MSHIIKSHVVKFAVISSILLVLYFHFTEIIGMAQRLELKLLNGVIFGALLFFMLRKERRASGPENFRYLNSFSSGMYYSIIVAVLYTAYLVLYFQVFNPDILEIIQEKNTAGDGATMFSIIVTTTMAALGSGIILTLAFLQLFKNKERNIKEKEMQTEGRH